MASFRSGCVQEHCAVGPPLGTCYPDTRMSLRTGPPVFIPPCLACWAGSLAGSSTTGSKLSGLCAGQAAGQHERRRHPVGQHLAVAAQSLQPPRPGHAHPQPGSGTAAGGRRRPASAPASRSPRRWMRCLSPLIEFRQWLPETVIGKVLRRELRTDEQGASPRMGSRTEVRGPDLLERLAPTRKPVTDGEFRSHPGTGPSSPAGRWSVRVGAVRPWAVPGP